MPRGKKEVKWIRSEAKTERARGESKAGVARRSKRCVSYEVNISISEDVQGRRSLAHLLNELLLRPLLDLVRWRTLSLSLLPPGFQASRILDLLTIVRLLLVRQTRRQRHDPLKDGPEFLPTQPDPAVGRFFHLIVYDLFKSAEYCADVAADGARRGRRTVRRGLRR